MPAIMGSVRIAGIIALLISAALTPVRAQEPKPRIAVLEFDRVQADEAEAAAVADKLRNELVNSRAFTVLDRTQTGAVLEELAFQREGFTEQTRAMELGRLLNVEFIVSGRLTRLADAYQVQAQMTDVGTGEIVRSESVVYQGDIVGLLNAQMPVLAARLANAAETPAPRPSEPPAVPPSEASAQSPRQTWSAMGMMRNGAPTWSLMAGGMMLMGAAMMASRMDDEQAGAALAVAAIGVGLITYYVLSRDDDPPSASGQIRLGSTQARVGVGIGLDARSVLVVLNW